MACTVIDEATRKQFRKKWTFLFLGREFGIDFQKLDAVKDSARCSARHSTITMILSNSSAVS